MARTAWDHLLDRKPSMLEDAQRYLREHPNRTDLTYRGFVHDAGDVDWVAVHRYASENLPTEKTPEAARLLRLLMEVPQE